MDLPPLPHPHTWQPSGNCRTGPVGRLPAEQRVAIFVRVDGDYRRARAICHRCPVAATCIEYALDNAYGGAELHGIWGGYGVRQLARLQRLRRAAGHRHDPACGCAYCSVISGHTNPPQMALVLSNAVA